MSITSLSLKILSPTRPLRALAFPRLNMDGIIQDASAAHKGLAACAGLMAEYDQCMSKVPVKDPIRVRNNARAADSP